MLGNPLSEAARRATSDLLDGRDDRVADLRRIAVRPDEELDHLIWVALGPPLLARLRLAGVELRGLSPHLAWKVGAGRR